MTKKQTSAEQQLAKFVRHFYDTDKITTGPVPPDHSTPCLIWKSESTGGKGGKHCTFWFWEDTRTWDHEKDELRKTMRYAFEVAWELKHGQQPENVELKLTCDEPLCANATHVTVVPASKITLDRRARSIARAEKQRVRVEREKAAALRAELPPIASPAAPVDNTVPDMITDENELRAIISGEPVSAPDNVTPIIRRDIGGYFVMAARELNVEHVHEDIEVEIDGQRRWRRIERIGLAPQTVIVFVKLGESGEYAHRLTPNAEVKLRYLDQTKLPVTGVAQ